MRSKVFRGGVALLVTLTALPWASAATYTWNAQSGTWSTASNWLDSVPYVSGADNTADFSKVSLTGDSTVALDAGITVGNLIFGDAGTGGYGYTLNCGVNISLSGATETNIIANTNTTLNGATIFVPRAATNKATVAAGKTLTIASTLYTDWNGGQNTYLHKYGSGTMVIANTNDNVFFNVAAHEGTVEFAGAGNGGSHAGGIAAIDAGATVKFTAASNDGYQVWGDNSNGTFDGVQQPGGGVVNITGGTLDFNGHDQFLTGLTVSSAGGTIANSSATTAATYTPAVTTLNGTLTVDTTSNLTLGCGSTQSWATGINGVGGIIKNGNATLYLTANNGYQGATTINAGALQIGSGGSSGTLGTADVTNNATLRFDRSDSAYVVSNNISGSGQLVKNGSGTITLSGSNTYQGDTTVNAGTLSVGSVTNNTGTGTIFITGGTLAYTGTSDSTGRGVRLGNATTNAINVASGGTLEFTGVVRSTADANAYLQKYGSGTLTLSNSGDNSFLYVSAHEGTVLFNSASAGSVHAGSISAIDSGATIRFTGTGDKQVWAGDWDFGNYSGGTIALTGGTLDLNGRSQVQTVFSVSSAGGTLANTNAAASSYTPYSSTLDGTLTVNAGGDITLGVGTSGSASTGSGGITKTGSGKLILSGTHGYAGATAVNAGTLVVNGSITGAGGDVTVASGAAVAGNGSILRNLIVQSGGNITPGNSVGNLTVGGNVDFSGTYQWELGSLVDNASGIAGTNWDVITMSLGTLSGSAPTINIAGIDPSSDVFWKSAHVWNIVTGIGGSTLSTAGGSITGYDHQYGYFDTAQSADGTGGIMQLTWTPVPEPSSVVMTVAGLVGLIAYAWRKRK